jgi:hypothetical protein
LDFPSVKDFRLYDEVDRPCDDQVWLYDNMVVFSDGMVAFYDEADGLYDGTFHPYGKKVLQG